MTLLYALVCAMSCAQPIYMQYDFGRATWGSARIQTNLSRESVSDSVYPLSGTEATLLRKNVQESSTDVESGEVESTK